MGCGCGGKGRAVTSDSGPRRVTVYQVQVNSQTVEEFDSLPAARIKAVELGGRVKVTSKTI